MNYAWSGISEHLTTIQLQPTVADCRSMIPNCNHPFPTASFFTGRRDVLEIKKGNMNDTNSLSL